MFFVLHFQFGLPSVQVALLTVILATTLCVTSRKMGLMTVFCIHCSNTWFS